MRRLRLIVEYDGTDFAGFQLQAAGIRTVQEALSEAVARITGDQATIHAAGRTDSGVHALGQVVHFETGSKLAAERIESALNAVLPRDVSVRQVEWVSDEFHARFSAVRRTYAYFALNRPSRSAVWDRFSAHEPKSLDLQRMRAVARELIGTNDFRSFASSGGNPGATYVRRVEKLQVRRAGELIVIRCAANAFLRSMVRNFAGMLLAAGRGAIGPSDAQAALEARDRTVNPCETAPARGLCLVRVDYNEFSGEPLAPLSNDTDE